MRRSFLLVLPIAVLIALAVLLARGLQSDPRKLDSVLIGKPAPHIVLPTLDARQFESEKLACQVWLLNVFASWCSACVIEHPQLVQLAEQARLPMVGLAYKDKTPDTAAWLKEHGNPYAQVALDSDGRTGINYGVYGVPETFVIDAQGIVRVRHAGPIDATFFAQQVAPLLAKATTP